ncbi:anthranilate phosphoribosyltransferase [Chishuiella changwenlii]|uniref:Anthranilate phosphoribosyltransferase n=1 Tax=Chishuiella changwenlii TaxID=1434701 RepID=A0A1M6T3C7_9FLAO|nr:anthranilate phosphoribosyltransferase [Chishuiella changwenlii]GGE94767.1 anthranilate phosphoribosyltransferase [Chishuiella changwenlii]SHK51434.1 anthranilate phosphoribosyltransferase [Chishuiella changwenlii]
MRKLLNLLFENYTLTEDEAYKIMVEISEEKYSPIELASFLTIFNMRNITLDELKGYRRALLDLCIKIDLPKDAIDIVGTGGDGKDTFNISTLSSFVLAGAGEKVIKQGNYGASSVSGSSNMLDNFGYNFTTDQGQLKKEVEEIGITFLHAPLFHPALAKVAPIRKGLAVKTFFNLMGPLVNPVQPNFQNLGTYDVKTARLYHYVMQNSGIEYSISTALDGYDEISLTSPTKVYNNYGEFILESKDFGLNTLSAEDIRGGNSIVDNSRIFLNVLEGNSTQAQKEVVLANSALALQTIYPSKNLIECVAIANESLESKKALNIFTKLIRS